MQGAGCLFNFRVHLEMRFALLLSEQGNKNLIGPNPIR
jgi:hypothetical protein